MPEEPQVIGSRNCQFPFDVGYLTFVVPRTVLVAQRKGRPRLKDRSGRYDRYKSRTGRLDQSATPPLVQEVTGHAAASCAAP